MKSKKTADLRKFNHWRKNRDKVKVRAAPHSTNAALNQEANRPFSSQDCTADPCTCTGEE